jgi:hypothetical protein
MRIARNKAFTVFASIHCIRDRAVLAVVFFERPSS